MGPTKVRAGSDARFSDLGWEEDDRPDRQHQQATERRNEILELVQAGLMSPLLAEELVVEEALYPLSSNPGVNSINIFDLPHWTIEMVLAWLIGRHREHVLLFHDPFRRDMIVWSPLFTGDEQTGYYLAHEEPASIAALYLHARQYFVTDDDEHSEVAKKKLWSALETGKIQAVAYDTHLKSVVTIRDFEWSYLTFGDIEVVPTNLRFESSNENRYSGIKLKTADVLVLWPPVGDQAEASWFSPYTHSIDPIVEVSVPENDDATAFPEPVGGLLTDRDKPGAVPAGKSKPTKVGLAGSTHQTPPTYPINIEDGRSGGSLRLSPTHQDIHEALEALRPGELHTRVPKPLRDAVDEYLKRERHYKKLPDAKTYQRYCKIILEGLARQ